MFCISAHLSRSLVDISEMHHNQKGGSHRLLSGEVRQLKSRVQNLSKDKCNKGHKHFLTHTHAGPKGKNTAARPHREMAAQKSVL